MLAAGVTCNDGWKPPDLKATAVAAALLFGFAVMSQFQFRGKVPVL